MDRYDPDATQIRDQDITQIHFQENGEFPHTSSDLETTTGHYILHQHLGEGGFAKVYLAEDRRTGHQVALKQLLPGPAHDSEIVHRFQSVAEHTRTLKHPNIISVYGYEIIEGRPSIVMEYVAGKSLRQILQERDHLSVDEALNITLQLCDALTYAHENGFIHRDVKPDNILVTPEGTVKLGDFDIAKITTGSALTRVGLRLGTPYYMSPEQVRGQSDVDARSDVFSVGAVLYEMVTGEVPVGHFGHPSEQNPDLPRRLGSVILKALARDRGSRYATIRNLREALTGSPETQQAQRHPFYFRNQQQPVQTIGALVELCERDWESARWHLTEGHFDRWLQVINPEMAHKIQTSLRDETDMDLALEKLLHLLDPTLPDPVLAVSPEIEIDLGEMAAGEVRSRELQVSNPSRGYLVGHATTNQPWLKVNPTEFRLKEGESLQLIVQAQAPATLGEHETQVVLESNGGTVEVSVRLRTTVRLFFPQAGQSAGSVDEMVNLCNTYRDEAIDLFYNGAIEQWLYEGPMRFDLIAHAQELGRRYKDSLDREEREKGLRAFLLACDPDKRPTRSEPFIFRTGEKANTIPELVKLCERHWADAQWHLYEGHFATWLEVVEPVLVAEAERIRETQQDRNLGVEQFLHLLDPELPSPKLEVEPQEFSLGDVAPDEKKSFSVTIHNAGRGYLAGRLNIPDPSWVHPLAPLGTSSAHDELGKSDTPHTQGSIGSLTSHILQSLRLRKSDTSHTQVPIGCLSGESQTFYFVVQAPAELGEHTTYISIESSGGQINLPVQIRVAPRLFFPEANLSVGSIEELAETSSKFWGETRTLWTNGDIREWLHRGLRRFDLVDTADQLQDPALSTDAQIIHFLLQACPNCQQWLPPYLQTGQETVDLGTVLHQTPPRRLYIQNIGGGVPQELHIIQKPTWIDAEVSDIKSSGVTLELVGSTRSLKENHQVTDSLVLELRGSLGDAELDPQHLSISIRMRVADSIRIGQWRIPFDGRVRIKSKTISVRALWVVAIGLVSLLPGILVGSLLGNHHLWTVGIWLAFWLAGGIIWAVYGLGYRDMTTLARDVLGWLRDVPQSMRRATQDILGWGRDLSQTWRNRK